MTRQADFKRRVRARMAKTGESYATARARLRTEHPDLTPNDAPLDWMPGALQSCARSGPPTSPATKASSTRRCCARPPACT
jgi:hypothetical protein